MEATLHSKPKTLTSALAALILVAGVHQSLCFAKAPPGPGAAPQAAVTIEIAEQCAKAVEARSRGFAWLDCCLTQQGADLAKCDAVKDAYVCPKRFPTQESLAKEFVRTLNDGDVRGAMSLVCFPMDDAFIADLNKECAARSPRNPQQCVGGWLGGQVDRLGNLVRDFRSTIKEMPGALTFSSLKLNGGNERPGVGGRVIADSSAEVFVAAKGKPCRIQVEKFRHAKFANTWFLRANFQLDCSGH